MNNHTEFILSPITNIIKDVVSASAGIGSGIETFPLYDYVMQSVFLKMTGFQEQKMKCICWEMATNDYEYRYDFTKTPLGECSNYNDKQKIYKDLIEQIKKYNPSSITSFDIKKSEIFKSSISEVKAIFCDTNLSIWAQNSFNLFENILEGMKDNCFSTVHIDINTKSMFIDCSNCSKNNKKNPPKCSNTSNIKNLKGIYEDHLYRFRNKIAHNTQSYQQNLPTLKTLVSEDYKYENYFVYFSVLVLIDSIFIEIYNKYLTALEDRTC